jgi:hypothetical protein
MNTLIEETSPYKIPLGTNRFEHYREYSLKMQKFNTDIVDLGLAKLNVK